MQITITGCQKTPTWDTLQTLLREAVDPTATLTRIARPDGNVNFQSVGVYELTLRVGQKPDTSDIPVTLTITG